MGYTTLGRELTGKDAIEFESERPFIKEVWRGLRPLGETFWRYYFLYAVVFINGTLICARILSDIFGSPWPIGLWILLAIPARIWIAVGLWRSATNNPGGWATLVKALIVVEVLYTLAQLVIPIVDAAIGVHTGGGGRRLNV